MRYVIWAPDARRELTEIWRYVALHDLGAADRLVDRIDAVAASLVDFPRKGRVIRRRLRQIGAAHPYVLRYRVNGNVIEILHVYHGARNVRSPRLAYAAEPALAWAPPPRQNCPMIIDLSRRGLMIGATGALALVPAVKAAPEGSIVARHGRLQVKGNRVVDSHGEPLTLRGVSLFWSQWKPAFYNAPCVAWLVKDWRIGAIRAAIAGQQGGYERDPERHTRLAETVIDAAIAEGIYVVIDWHAHEPKPELAARFLTHIAAKYRGVPNLIYETYNEPLPQHGWKELLVPYHAHVIGAIRAIDPGAFVVAGVRSWTQDVEEAAADPLPFDNVALSLHYYAATHRQELRAKAELAMQRGAALFITEYGVTDARGAYPIDEAEAQRWWEWCEKHGISHLAWSIEDKDEACAALLPGTSPFGGWPADRLTRSGTLVRARIRSKQ
jgi:endoglucanase